MACLRAYGVVGGPMVKSLRENVQEPLSCVPPRMESGWRAQGGDGLEFDGTFKSAVSVAQRQQILGRRILWNRVSGPNRIDLIYRDKPLKTIRTVFGDPDVTDDGLWTQGLAHSGSYRWTDV